MFIPLLDGVILQFFFYFFSNFPTWKLCNDFSDDDIELYKIC